MENKDEQLTTGEIQREAITKELRDMLREELAKQNVPVVDQVAAQPLTTLHQPKTVPLAIPVGSEPRIATATPPGVELSALLAPTPDKPIVIAGPAPAPSKVAAAPKAAAPKSGRSRLIAMTAAIGVLAVAATGGALWMSAKRNTSAVGVARADAPRPQAPPAESVVSLPVGARTAPPVAAAPVDPAPAPAAPAAAKTETTEPAAAKPEGPKPRVAAAPPVEAKAKVAPPKEDPKPKPVAKAADEPAKPAAPPAKPAPAGVDAILQQQLNNTLP